MTRTLLLIATFASLLAIASPAGAYQVFVSVDGIPGDVSDPKFNRQIAALSFSWSVSQAATGAVSSVGNISGQRASLSDFTITKTLDSASVPLAMASAAGTRIRTVRVYIVNNGQIAATFTLSNVIVSRVSQAAASSNDPNGFGEEVAFAYEKIEASHTTFDGRGRPVGTQTQGWDLSRNVRG